MSSTPMPSYNPNASGQPALATPVPPKQINWAFLLLLAAAFFQLVATAFTVAHLNSPGFRDEISAELAKQNVDTQGMDLVSTTIGLTIGTTIVTGVLAIAAYVVLAFLLKQGRGWARIVAAVLAVLSLTLLMGMVMPSGLFTILQVLCGAAAVVFCFIAPGATYFTEMKNHRLAKKQF